MAIKPPPPAKTLPPPSYDGLRTPRRHYLKVDDEPTDYFSRAAIAEYIFAAVAIAVIVAGLLTGWLGAAAEGLAVLLGGG